MRALDNMSRRGKGRAGKRRSPSYSNYYGSRSNSRYSYRKKGGRGSRSESPRRRDSRSRSPGSKSDRSFRDYSKHSDQQGTPRGDIEQGSPQRSRSVGSAGPRNPEENGHVEEKKIEDAAEVQPPATETAQNE